MELLELARIRRFAILEDDYDHEFHFSGRPVLPLASADESGVVIHVGSLSKVLAPGLRVGFAVAQSPIVESMALHRRYLDRQGDHAMELALSYLIEDGELGAHIRRMHRAYTERRDVLHESLRAKLSRALSFRVPSGGIALWARVTCGVKPERWCEAALEQGVLVQPGRQYRFDGASTPFIRLGFARHTPAEIRDGVHRLVRGLESLGG
jgi:GntR family transcriptional regulator/MocR family aminotransferase